MILKFFFSDWLTHCLMKSWFISSFTYIWSAFWHLKRWQYIVTTTSALWRHVSFNFALNLTKSDFVYLLQHSRGFWEFHIPAARIQCITADLDFNFISYLSNAKQLYWLDLSDYKLSTLCFLKSLPSLEILNVSGCKNLVDADFEVLKECHKLDRLYLSFTCISPNSLINICDSLSLTVLDTTDVYLSKENRIELLAKSYTTLLFWNLSLNESQTDIDLAEIRNQFLDVNLYITKRHWRCWREENF